jgi:hypothetical protein
MPERPVVRVTDLRGSGGLAPSPVLADPSGRRAIHLHRLGRVVGLLFLVWFLCLVLAGLGLLPASGVPLAGSVAPRTQPRQLAQLPRPAATSAADLRPARGLSRHGAPARSGASSGAGSSTTTSSGTRGGTGRRPAPSAHKPAKTLPAVTTTGSGPSAAVPLPATATHGQSTTTHGKSTTAPGHTTPKPAKSGTTTTGSTTTATTPGRSGSAPGQTRTDTTGHGPPK